MPTANAEGGSGCEVPKPSVFPVGMRRGPFFFYKDPRSGGSIAQSKMCTASHTRRTPTSVACCVAHGGAVSTASAISDASSRSGGLYGDSTSMTNEL